MWRVRVVSLGSMLVIFWTENVFVEWIAGCALFTVGLYVGGMNGERTFREQIRKAEELFRS